MRGSLMIALRRWTSTPDAETDFDKSSPRSEELSTGEAPPASGTDDPVADTLFTSARPDVSAPRLAAGGKPGAALGRPTWESSGLGPPVSPPPGAPLGGVTVGGGCGLPLGGVTVGGGC